MKQNYFESWMMNFQGWLVRRSIEATSSGNFIPVVHTYMKTKTCSILLAAFNNRANEKKRSCCPILLAVNIKYQCMFFGASMGRLGTDFRGLLVPVFEKRVTGASSRQWATASAEFVVTLRDIAGWSKRKGVGYFSRRKFSHDFFAILFLFV